MKRQSGSPRQASQIQSGSITFGPHEWNVLSAEAGIALLLTRHVIDTRSIGYPKAREDMDWSGSEMREWLNGEFCDRFTASQKARILTTQTVTKANPFRVLNGDEKTLVCEDRVFLLSLDEVLEFMGRPESVGELASRNPKPKWLSDGCNHLRQAHLESDSSREAFWWLRTGGTRAGSFAYVSLEGQVNVLGATARASAGVRAALRMRLG